MSTFIRESGKYKPYALQHKWRRRGFSLLKLILIVLLLFLVITTLFLSSYRIRTSSMAPTFSSNDCMLITPFVYGPFIPFTSKRFFSIQKPERGDIVVYTPPAAMSRTFFEKLIDPVARFFTLNHVYSINSSLQHHVPKKMIKRILAVPGDTVKVEKNHILIKPADKNYFSGETEIIPVLYRIRVPDGNTSKGDITKSEELKLGEHQYFLVGDNRGESTDSRDFGPVDFSQITGRVIFRYWPVKRISAF